MAITAAGIAKIIAYWETQWDKIEVLDAEEVETADKVPVLAIETGYLESTVYFAPDEANFSIAKVKTYSGATVLAENTVALVKTDRQSLTIVRRDYLEGV